MNNHIYLSLGSNIEPERNLHRAVSLLGTYGALRAVSTVWETAPLGGPSQPNYLNAVVLLEGPLTAREVQDRVIPAVESELGRVRTSDRYSPRTMDIDILLFNEEVLQLDHRQIPNPEIETRPFVAIPLAEIAPKFVHPVLKRSLADLAGAHQANPEAMRRRPDVRLKRQDEAPTDEAQSRA